MRVLVCGSRTFADSEVLATVLSGIYPWPTMIIHGAAAGADTLADEFAVTCVPPVAVRDYAADWDLHGKKAGYLRNVQMLEQGQPDLCVAFIDKPLEESRGTANMVSLCRGAGVKVIIVWVPA